MLIDQTRFAQVLRNLLSNAVKFSPDGGEITLSIVEKTEFALLSIRDVGVGIPDDELDVIFDKFAQSSRTKTGAGGTGLGLAISREIISAHNGRIWAKNAPEGGAIFYVQIPRSTVDCAVEARPTSQLAP